MDSSLRSYGAFLLEIPGIDALFTSLEAAEFAFEGFKGPSSSSTWLMDEEHINTPSEGKKSYFMFNPEAEPGHFGQTLIDYISLVKANKLVKTEIAYKGLKSAVGIHYYGYIPNTSSPSLGEHNDVNWWSIINTNGPISMWIGKWTKFSKNIEDNPDVLLEKDAVVVMRGLSCALLEGDSPVLHKVDGVKRKKFTVGIFLELEDKNTLVKTPEGRELSVGDFSASYFGVTEQTPDVYRLKHEYVRVY